MSTDKDSGSVSYKFKELKVYASTEWLADGKKKYQRVFEASQVGYLYTEFTFYNKLFDERSWKTKVELKCTQVDDNLGSVKDVCTVTVDREVLADENVVFIREGWGNATLGQFWKKGRYKWEAFLDGVSVGSTIFYIENGGVVTPAGNPYFGTTSIKLFEGPGTLPPQNQRTYYSKYSSKDTRYIWAEVNMTNNRPDEDWYCELVYLFYNDARQLKGRTEELITVRKGTNEYTLCSGWGSDTKGTWYLDNYTLEVVFMEQLVAVLPFNVGEVFEEGVPAALTQVEGVPLGAAVAAGKAPEKTFEELMAELDSLVGLDGIKKKLREYTQYLGFLKVRKEKGFDDPQKVSLHAVFTGNPGTGKTTVAMMLGKLYKSMGLLEKGHVVEVDRADLVAEYIGQTAPKTKAMIEKARGGILFIDEAYSLARKGEDSKDFGKEVIEIVLKEMSDGTGDFAVIVAGYPDEMSNFLDSNPGLKSRFNMYYDFPDYVPQELMQISKYSSDKKKVKFTDDAEKFLYEKLVEAYRTRDRSFGNARYVHSLVDTAKMNMGLRVMAAGNVESLTDDELSTIKRQDVERIFNKDAGKKADIPVDEFLLRDALAELNSLTGLDSVKNEINELVKLVKYYREIGKDVMNLFSLHSIFYGNPGTGKTTVARILAKIFKGLGILEKGHLVEVDRQKLVGKYVGETAQKTAEAITASIGGVFFVDEAYALTQGGSNNDYGKEAVETILKRMEDLRGQFIVIAAGYPDNMDEFLESNPGLKSRFDKTFNFEDYNPAQLWEICQGMFRHENLTPDPQAEAHLKNYLGWLHQNKDKFFGNARSVRKVVEEAVKNQHLRLAGMDKNNRTDEARATVTFADVEEFQLNKDDMITKTVKRIGFATGGQ